MAEKKETVREEEVAEAKPAPKPPERTRRADSKQPKRHPLDWAARLGIHPDKPGKPGSGLPAGVGRAMVAGASVANGWSRLRNALHEPVAGIEVTEDEFIGAVVAWMRAPSPEARDRLLRFKARVAKTEGEQLRKKEVNDG